MRPRTLAGAAATLTAGALFAATGPVSADPRPAHDPGMARMHELMRDGDPGMARMHELMRDGDPGMARMHELMRDGDPAMMRMHERMMTGSGMHGMH